MDDLTIEDPEQPEDPQRTRRAGVTAGLGGTAFGLAAVAAVAFMISPTSDPDTIATDNELIDTVPSTVATTTTEPVFVTSPSTVAASIVETTTTTTLPPTTTTLPPTTTTLPPTTTTLPPTTVPPTLAKQTSQPIAPPPDPRGYENEIRLGSIAIPKLGVSEPLFSGIRLTTLDKGPGHWPGTAMPGQIGNVVVAGHRTSHGAPFRYLNDLVAGDSVVFDTGSGPINYTVTGTQIVGPDAIWITNPTDTPTATLFACHPPGSTRQRIVVNLALS